MIARRGRTSSVDLTNPTFDFAPDASSDGSDYRYESSESDEPLEWTSDDELAFASDVDVMDVDDIDNADYHHSIQSFWHRTAATCPQPPLIGESLLPLFKDQSVAELSREGAAEGVNTTRSSVTMSGALSLREHNLGQPSHSRYPFLIYNEKEERDVEHIAGPSCRNNCGG